MAITYNLRDKHDARARELGFKDRHEMRAAIKEIASTMSMEDYDSLSRGELEILLKEKAVTI